MSTLNELIGSYDNLDEPIPWINEKSTIYGLIIPILIITSICVSFRLYVRYWVTRTPGWDDYLVIATFLTAWGANVGCCLLVDNGLGQHFVLLGLTGMADFTRMFWWCNGLYNMCLALVKLSLLAQYLRLLDENPHLGGGQQRQQPRLRLAIRVLLFLVAAWGVAWSLVAWVPCSPVAANWDFSGAYPDAARWGYGSRDTAVFVATFYNHAAANMVLDILIISLPLLSRSLWATAEMERRSQLGLVALFLVGGLSVVCSVVRFVYIIKYHATTYPTFDPTWYGAYTLILSVVEVDLATIVASLPVFWPHLRREVASILITHEIEIKVTRKSEFFAAGGGGNNNSTGRNRRSTRHGAGPALTGTHWDVEVGDNNPPWSRGGGGDRAGSTDKETGTVMMRDLGAAGRTRTMSSDDVFSVDGVQRPQRCSTRLAPMSRESREVLLK